MNLRFNLIHPDVNCDNCEDTGYRFDTLFPCHECELGKPIKHLQNITELRWLESRARILRKQIKQYEKENEV